MDGSDKAIDMDVRQTGRWMDGLMVRQKGRLKDL